MFEGPLIFHTRHKKALKGEKFVFLFFSQLDLYFREYFPRAGLTHFHQDVFDRYWEVVKCCNLILQAHQNNSLNNRLIVNGTVRYPRELGIDNLTGEPSIQAKDLEDAIKPLNKNGVIVLPQEAAMIANYGFGIRSRAFIIDFDCLRFGTKQDFFPLKSQFSIISPRLRSQSQSQSQSMDTEDD